MVQQKIRELTETIIAQAGDIEDMYDHFYKGYLGNDKEVLSRILAEEETNINEKEIKIDEKCTSILALYRPEAVDLRTVFMIARMNIDLERIGDHLVNMAESASYLVDHPLKKSISSIIQMLDITKKMLADSIQAFVDKDVKMAKKVCETDQTIDDLNEKVFHELTEYMNTHPVNIEKSMHIIRISNNIEKIADLTTNISEQVIYICSGKIIKHHNLDISNDK